jgi:NAD(P)-dependent dehydrogenase (short-subunit alcohol dehydrogenase family)
MDALAGRTAVVTGAASGIGLALAERLVAEGMRVVMSDVDPKRLADAAGRIRVEGEILAVAGDVSRWEDVERLAAEAASAFGPVHLLCNNAGVQSSGTVWEYELRDWRWLLGVNLWGVIHGIKAFVPGMIEHGSQAHVVNTSSVGGLVTFPGMAPYAASKSAVIAISESLHLDLRAHDVPIGVSVLCPGPTMSDLRENSTLLRPTVDEQRPLALVTHVPRMPAEEVAGIVVAAVLRDRFWIVTHPEYVDEVERRARGIATGDVVVRGEVL